jgi:ABC-type lipoprotein release transport system permease subunit
MHGFDVQPLDPLVFASGAGTLVIVVVLATLLPARLAAATDPAVVLRAE